MLLTGIRVSVSRPAVNKNANMHVDLLSKILLPRFQVGKIGVGESHRIHALCRRRWHDLQPSQLFYILQSTWPFQGQKKQLIYITTSAMKLLPFLMSATQFTERVTRGAELFWSKAVLQSVFCRLGHERFQHRNRMFISQKQIKETALSAKRRSECWLNDFS